MLASTGVKIFEKTWILSKTVARMIEFWRNPPADMIENTGCAGVGGWWFVVGGFFGREGGKASAFAKATADRLRHGGV